MYGVWGMGMRSLKAGASEGFHHLISGVGASVEALTADDLVLGGKTQLGGEVVFGLGAAGVDHLLLLAVAVNVNS